jgi:hypothetical protein
MRATFMAIVAALLLVATSVTAEANGRGGPWGGFPDGHYPRTSTFGHHSGPSSFGHNKDPYYYHGGLICKKIVVTYPTKVSWRRGWGHGHHGIFVKKIVIICHRPVSS